MELTSLPYFLVFISLFLFLYLYLFPSLNKPKPANGFTLYPILGTLPELIRNRHRFLDWMTEVLSCCPSQTSEFRRPGKLPGIITANPLNVEHMLKTNFENYPKGDRFIPPFKDFLGHGIFNVDSDLWKLQRNTALYEFNTRSLRKFFMETAMVQIQTRLIPTLKDAAQTKHVLDLQDSLERFAFDNVCMLSFNVDPGCLGCNNDVNNAFMLAFGDAAMLCFGRFLYAVPFFWKVKRFLQLGSERRLREAVKTVHDFADGIIQLRLEKKTDQSGEDLLSRFMKNNESSPEFLRDIVISFILAGRDTTASVLCWFFWLLSSRPDVEEKILEELNAIRRRSGKRMGEAYSFDELREMNYLHATLSETMRLHPPVAVMQKACISDDTFPDGTFVGKGWSVTYSSYAMGRMESIWGEDCRKFRPERWLKDGVHQNESPFRFPAFNAGPRTCLGKEMAYLQMKCVAASVLERFEVDVLEKKRPETSLSMVHRMKGGLHVRVTEKFVEFANSC
ncbi:cytochrome P450 CYP94D108-like [Malania oleifera]|uniref:cytochrome P450 CYP94D108-like n=1 Tax=Malania oleifera TaxID=397392 RepID=UPI0025ADD651|nr:cytochrome P450 CYP94D108-like [Malania oleifera]